MGPYGPKRYDFVEKIINFDENYKIVNKSIKGVESEKLKVKTWFCDKDVSFVNLLSKTDDFTNTVVNKNVWFIRNNEFA